jgi:hypothetical protein
MSLKRDILKLIADDPIRFREVLDDSEIKRVLSDIGVLPKILELHTPSPNARTKSGLGRTLCGINGTRHPLVTCKKCRKQLGE